jgi:hypothetical protein
MSSRWKRMKGRFENMTQFSRKHKNRYLLGGSTK